MFGFKEKNQRFRALLTRRSGPPRARRILFETLERRCLLASDLQAPSLFEQHSDADTSIQVVESVDREHLIAVGEGSGQTAINAPADGNVDLVIRNLAVPSSAAFGETIGISWFVENKGTSVATNRVKDRVYLSVDEQWSEDDVLLGEFQSFFSFPLPPGIRYQQSKNVQLTEASPNARFLLVVTDAENEQSELDEQNNILAAPITLKVPDLSVSNAKTTGTGSRILASWEVVNLGDSIAGFWKEAVYLSMDSSLDSQDIELKELTVFDRLEYQQKRFSSTFVDTAVVPSSGDYYLLIVEDSEHVFGELDEANNVRVLPINVELPDLTIPSASIKTNSPVRLDQSFQVNWTVVNQREVPFSGFAHTEIFLSADDRWDPGDVLLDSDTSGAFQTTSTYPNGMSFGTQFIRIEHADPGDAYLLFVVNRSGPQGDVNRNNNVYARAIEIDGPEFSISNLQVPSHIPFGNSTPLRFTVTNNSITEASEPGTLFVHLSSDEILDAEDSFVAEYDIRLPAAGESSDHERTVLLKMTGPHFLFLSKGLFDGKRQILSSAISVDGAEIVLDEATVPATAATSQLIRVPWTIRNEGPARSWTLWPKAYLSVDDVFDREVEIELTPVTYSTASLSAGEEKSSETTFRLPENVRGNFNVFVIVDFQGDTNPDNNLVSFPIAITGPDLTVTSLQAPADATVGESINVSWQIHNDGLVSANASWNSALYLSQDGVFDSQDLRLTPANKTFTALLPPTSPDVSFTTQVKLPQFPPGNYYILAVADEGKRQGETNELNNTAAVPLSLLAPDLVVTEVTAPPAAEPGSEIRVQYTVKNIGTVTANAHSVNGIYLSRLGKYDSSFFFSPVKTTKGPTLIAPGDSYSADVTIRLPSDVAGQYYVVVRADHDDQQAETHEGNNDLSASIVLHGSDLAPSPLMIPGEATVGESVTVKWRVSNIGSRTTARRFDNAVYLSKDDHFDDDDHLVHRTQAPVNALLTQDSMELAAVIKTNSAMADGKYWLIVADSGEDEAELDEKNNVLAVPIRWRGADLQITQLDAPSDAVTGQAIEVKWSVVNQGSDPASSDWHDRFYLSKSSNDVSYAIPLDHPVLSAGNLNVGAGYSEKEIITVPSQMEPGDYFLIAVTNSNWATYNQEYEQAELDRANNLLARRITIGAPDLTVSKLDVPQSIVVGESIDITWTIVNQGIVPAFTTWHDRLYLSEDAQLNYEDIQLKEAMSPTPEPLPGSAGYSTTATVTIPQKLIGTAFLLLLTDASAKLSETNEQNNLLSIPIEISAPDLVLTDVRGPETGYVGQSIELSWIVKNQGTVPALSSWEETIHISTDPILDGLDRQIAATPKTVGLQAGEVLRRSLTVTLPGIHTGDVYLLVTADAQVLHWLPSAQLETNELNNTIAIPISIVASDLVLSNANVPAKVRLEESFEISWRVSNGGAVPAAGRWSDIVYLSSDDKRDIHDSALVERRQADEARSVEPSQSYLQTAALSFSGLSPGPRFLLFVTDAWQQITETDSNNNIVAVPIEILSSDLAVTALTVPPIMPNDNHIDVTWTITNQGNEAAVGNWQDKLFLTPIGRQPGYSADQELLSINTNFPEGLAPGESYTQTMRLQVAELAGAVSLGLLTDESRQISDPSRANNIRHTPVENLQFTPNLRAMREDELIKATVDTDVRLFWSIENTGRTPATENWKIRVYHSKDQYLDNTDRPLTQYSHTMRVPVAAGSSVDFGDWFRITSHMYGEGFLLIKIDEDDVIKEFDETDNVKATPILVTAAAAPLHNPAEATDVNGDGQTAPQDILIVINELNQRRFSEPKTSRVTADLSQAEMLFDVTGDGFLTPADSLAIINWINGIAEGESGKLPIITHSISSQNHSAPMDAIREPLETTISARVQTVEQRDQKVLAAAADQPRANEPASCILPRERLESLDLFFELFEDCIPL